MGKASMFMMLVFIAVSLAGNVLAGDVGFCRTELTADITAASATIPVTSTEGFSDVGIIVIGDERIAYSVRNATSFAGTLVVQPLVRGASDTEAVAHVTGDDVTTVPGAMLNTAANYHIAVLADASGLQGFVAGSVAFWQLIGSFLFLPLSFLGTDLEILSVVWGVVGIGMIISLVIALAGGRHV